MCRTQSGFPGERWVVGQRFEAGRHTRKCRRIPRPVSQDAAPVQVNVCVIPVRQGERLGHPPARVIG